MKRKELEVGAVLAYQPSKFGAIEAAVVLGVEPVREQHTHGESRQAVVACASGNNAHVALLYNSVDRGNGAVAVRERAVPLTALRGDWWEVMASHEIEDNTRHEYETKARAQADVEDRRAELVVETLAKIGVEAFVGQKHRVVMDLDNAAVLADWIKDVKR